MKILQVDRAAAAFSGLGFESEDELAEELALHREKVVADLVTALKVAEATIRLDGERLRSLGRSTRQADYAIGIIRPVLIKAIKGE